MRTVSWPGSRTARRTVAVIAAAVWLVTVSPYPRSLDGAGMPLILGLIAVDVVLGAITNWLAFARTSSLDERQAALRDRAYRFAFRLVLAGVLIMVVGIFIGSILDSSQLASAPQPQPVLGARWLVGLLELIVALPTAVVAWLDPGSLDDPAPASLPPLLRRWVPLLAVPIFATSWLLIISLAPLRANAVRDDAQHSTYLLGATCGHFSGSEEAGYGFGAQVRLDVEACWDGKHAFTFRLDPEADMTRCEVPHGTADFARVTHLTCTERTDASGTMFYTVRARIESGLASAVTRDVVMELDVSKDGKVLAFG